MAVNATFLKALDFEQKGEFMQAINAYKEVIETDTSLAAAASYNNLGILEQSLGHIQQAYECFKKAIELDPSLDTAHFNLGNIFQSADDHKNALICYTNTLKVNPSFQLAFSNLYFSMRQICLWESLDELSQKIDKLPASTETPFISVVRTENLKRNLDSSQNLANEIAKSTAFLRKKIFSFPRKRHKSITIGYVSDGFRDFPTAQNLVGVFENHDKKKFRIIAYSLREQDNSSYSKRIIKSVSKYVELANLNPLKAARKIYQDKVDILVDLKGFTEDNRFEIFTFRPAPIQINFLGFAGSLGSKFHDYMIVDKTVVPKNHQKYYTEKLAYMPDTYWPTDSKLLEKIQPEKFENKNNIVFCSFNRSYKIEEQVFKAWMRILKRVTASKLQLLKTNDEAKNNLLKYAKNEGVDEKRIEFLKNLPKLKHIERIKKTDIALDTHKIGGHTTTIDALTAGVPVITVLGNHFASRVSASMLSAIGLPELITKNLKEYEDLAVKLATNPKKLNTLRLTLNANKKTHPLFNTRLFTKNLEKAYEIMWLTYKDGKNKQNIKIS